MNKHNEYELPFIMSHIKQICYEFAEHNNLKETLDIVDAITEATLIVEHYEWRKKHKNLAQYPSAEYYWKNRLAHLKNVYKLLNNEK